MTPMPTLISDGRGEWTDTTRARIYDLLFKASPK
jgi:hypothetical protein